MSVEPQASIHVGGIQSKIITLRPGTINLASINKTPNQKSANTLPMSTASSSSTPSSPVSQVPISGGPNLAPQLSERSSYQKKTSNCVHEIWESQIMPARQQMDSILQLLAQQELSKMEEDHTASLSELRSTHEQKMKLLKAKVDRAEAKKIQLTNDLQAIKAERDLYHTNASRFEQQCLKIQQKLADAEHENRELNDTQAHLVNKNTEFLVDIKHLKEKCLLGDKHLKEKCQLVYSAQQAELRAYKDCGAFVDAIFKKAGCEYDAGVLQGFMSAGGLRRANIEDILSRTPKWIRWMRTAKREVPPTSINNDGGRKRISTHRPTGGDEEQEQEQEQVASAAKRVCQQYFGDANRAQPPSS